MSDMNNEQSLDEKTHDIYKRFRSAADRFCYTFRRSTVSPDSLPCVLFLGNHSSGKSSFINHLIGGGAVQDVGIAPTDDMFTFLVWGEEERETTGPGAVAMLPKELAALSDFGPELVQRIRVKVRNRELLRNVILVDSPGMIDAGEKSISRGYNFFGAIGFLAEVSDLVLMLFDPDKPGTTGEAVEAIKGPLSGMFFKLRVIFNKCDRFTSMYDYARAYGALCWNLAHALPIKDLPKIYNSYLPGSTVTAGSSIDLHDFDALRDEIIDEVKSAKERRADNIQVAVDKDLSCLEMHMRLALRVRRALAKRQWIGFLVLVGGTALFAAAGFLVGNFCGIPFTGAHGLGDKILLGLQVIGIVLLTGLVGWVIGVAQSYGLNRFLESQIEYLDALFEDEYLRELSLGTRDDLRKHWEMTRPLLAGILRTRWRDLPLFSWGALGRLRNRSRHL